MFVLKQPLDEGFLNCYRKWGGCQITMPVSLSLIISLNERTHPDTFILFQAQEKAKGGRKKERKKKKTNTTQPPLHTKRCLWSLECTLAVWRGDLYLTPSLKLIVETRLRSNQPQTGCCRYFILHRPHNLREMRRELLTIWARKKNQEESWTPNAGSGWREKQMGRGCAWGGGSTMRAGLPPWHLSFGTTSTTGVRCPREARASQMQSEAANIFGVHFAVITQ